MKKVIIGVFLVFGIAASWCSCKQFTYYMQAIQHFNDAAFFVMWYQTAFISLAILYPFLTCQSIKKNLEKDNITFSRIIKLGFLFFGIWLVANYISILALQLISGRIIINYLKLLFKDLYLLLFFASPLPLFIFFPSFCSMIGFPY